MLDGYSQEQKQELVDCCPTLVFELDEGSNKVTIARPQDCIFCKECIFTAGEWVCVSVYMCMYVCVCMYVCMCICVRRG